MAKRASSIQERTSLTKGNGEVLQQLRELHNALKGSDRLGDLPKQATLAKKAIAYCIEAFERGKKDCACPVPDPDKSRIPTRFLCPACQRAIRTLRIWLQVESLSVKRAQVEAKIFGDLIRASKGEPAVGDTNLNFVALVRALRENPDAAIVPPVPEEVIVGA